jgi:hypothetical protein
MGTNSSLSKRLYFIMNAMMVMIYAGSGIAVYFWESLSLPPTTRKVLSLTLIMYSFYRGFLLFKKFKSSTDEN